MFFFVQIEFSASQLENISADTGVSGATINNLLPLSLTSRPPRCHYHLWLDRYKRYKTTDSIKKIILVVYDITHSKQYHFFLI